MIKTQLTSKKEHAQTFAQVAPSGRTCMISEQVCGGVGSSSYKHTCCSASALMPLCKRAYAALYKCA